IANENLLALNAADAGRAASIGNLFDFGRRRIELVICENRGNLRVARVIAPDPLGIGHHFRYLFRYLFFRLSDEYAISIALAHLPSVEAGEHRGIGQEPVGNGEYLALVHEIEPASDFPGQL